MHSPRKSPPYTKWSRALEAVEAVADVVAAVEVAQDVEMGEEVPMEAHRLSTTPPTLGGPSPGTQTCPRSARARSTGFLGNPHIGVKSQLSVLGSSTYHHLKIKINETGTSPEN